MHIHEYQAKQLMARFGISVPVGKPAFSCRQAQDIALDLDGDAVVLKAQIHAGGRGAGRFIGQEAGLGGVRVVSSKNLVEEQAQQMLNRVLVTKQTWPRGQEVKCLYVETASAIDREIYLSIVLDRVKSQLLILASKKGGMDIEDVAVTAPHALIYRPIDIRDGISDEDVRYILEKLDLKGHQATQGKKLLYCLFEMYVTLDMELLEINPLVVTKEGQLLVLDAKVSFDDNALYRQPQIESLRDSTQEDPVEHQASDWNLNYVKLDGRIGCMVNGAGLAMATMDIIKLKGETPANFLDVGGTATPERVTRAFEIILSDKNVKGVLVNIFGGIVRCDVIAKGINEALENIHLKVPLVVRLQGTNDAVARKILQRSQIPLLSATTLDAAADKIVACVRKE